MDGHLALLGHDDRGDRRRMMFGSIALVADGMHMSTHVGALFLAAIAYTYARKHANDHIRSRPEPTSSAGTRFRRRAIRIEGEGEAM
jgi:hypothetical protein